MIPIIFSCDGQFLSIPTQFTMAPMQPQVQFIPVSNQMMLVPSLSTFLTTTSHSSEILKKSIRPANPRVESSPQPHSKSIAPKNEEKQSKRVQNPYRNIYTNIINLILNFIVCKKKIGNLMERIDASLVADKLVDFYKYVKDLKSYFCAYFNVQKVKKLFKGTDVPFFNTDFHRVLRIATRYILDAKIPACLMTSKKLSPSLREEHFKAKRVITLILGGNTSSRTFN